MTFVGGLKDCATIKTDTRKQKVKLKRRCVGRKVLSWDILLNQAQVFINNFSHEQLFIAVSIQMQAERVNNNKELRFNANFKSQQAQSRFN